jgi:DNA-binding MarR family transcriptional regulator
MRSKATLNLLNRVHTLTRDWAVRAGASGTQLHPATLRPLLTLYHNKHPVTASALAETLGISVASTARTVAQLRNLGLVQSVQHESDQRQHLLTLSPLGRKIAESAD